jgi:hypothetical protein
MGDLVDAEETGRFADIEETESGVAVVPFGAGGFLVGISVFGANGRSRCVKTKRFAPFTCIVDALAAHASLPRGAAVRLRKLAAQVVALLSRKSVAKLLPRQADLGQAGSFIAVVRGLTGGLAEALPILGALRRGEVARAERGPRHTRQVGAFATHTVEPGCRTIHLSSQGPALGIANEHDIVLAPGRLRNANAIYACRVQAELVGGAGLGNHEALSAFLANDNLVLLAEGRSRETVVSHAGTLVAILPFRTTRLSQAIDTESLALVAHLPIAAAGVPGAWIGGMAHGITTTKAPGRTVCTRNALATSLGLEVTNFLRRTLVVAGTIDGFHTTAEHATPGAATV